MQAVHKTLLEVNEEFLVSEAPTTPLLQALLDKHVLTELDVQQLSSLEAQGSRAVKRFVLHVLPLRGPLAYPALLESLQEAQAQHLVDLLLEGEAVLSAAVRPIELPEPPTPPKPAEDPNEYARKLRANRELIEQAVKPQDVTPLLLQNGVLTALEEALLESVQGQHELTWSVLWGVVLQRGLRAYRAFMGALLQKGYSALFHTIEETKVTGAEAMKMTLSRNMAGTDHNRPAPDNHRTHTPVPLMPNRGSEAPAFRASSQPFTVSAGSREIVPGGASHPHADPLRPGYSLGDLEFMYTPRTQKQESGHGAPAPVLASSSVDVLYQPAWADPFNHLRRSDVVSPRPHHGGTSLHGAKENGTTTTALPSHPGYPSPDPNHGGKPNEHEHAPSNENTDDQRGAEPPARLEAISEQDAESERGDRVPQEKSEKLSPENDHDQTAEKPSDDPGLKKASSPSEEPRRTHSSPEADRHSSGAQQP